MFRWLLSLCSLLVVLSLPSVCAQALIETIAGARPRSGPPEETGLRTAGTAWDLDGNAYVAKYDAIWKIRPDGYAERIAGTGEWGYGGDGGPAVAAQLASPQEVRRDAAGNLYFLDRDNFRIRKIDGSGVITTVMGNGIRWSSGMTTEGRATEVALSSDTSFDVGPTGTMYATLGMVVHRLDAAGEVKAIGGAIQATGPLAVGASGEVLYATGGEAKRITAGGAIETLPDVRVPSLIQRVALDAEGNAFVGHFPVGFPFGGGAGPPFITRVAPDGTTTQFSYGTSAVFRGASGEAVYTSGGTVRRVTDQVVIADYPSVALAPPADGTPATAAVLDGLQSLAVNHRGEVYFAHSCVVRKIDAGGQIQRVAAVASPCDGFSMTFDAQDRLWVRSYGTTHRLETDGTFHQTEAPWASAWEIAVDAKGRLYHGTLAPASYIERLEEDGIFHRVTADGTNLVRAANGSVVIGEDGQNNVYFLVREPDGSVWLHRVNDDRSHTAISKLSDLTSVAPRLSVDPQGRVWSGVSVTDGTRTAMLGQVGGFAGTTVGYGKEKGFAQEAGIRALVSALAPNGDLYVLESSRIRRITGLNQTPQPQITNVVSSASYAGGGIAWGEIVSVLGSGFGMEGVTYSAPVNNRVPNSLERVKVLFNGIPGAILGATGELVNVVVPFTGVVGKPQVKVEVQVDDAISDPFPVAGVATAFHLYTADSSGSGQGAILNANASLNSRANPAKQGSVIVLYGTGAGDIFPLPADGALNMTTPYGKAKTGITVRIGGRAGEVVWDGSAPTLPFGMYQINVRLPDGVPSGDVPLEVIMGGGQTSRPVTVAVE